MDTPHTAPLRILLLADGSDFTERAARFLVAHARHLEHVPDVHLLHVAAPIGTPLARAQLSREVLDDYYRDVATAALLAAADVLKAAGMPFTTHHAVGDAADQIIASIGELTPDLIVMGTHGRSAFKSMVMGSVATRVLAHTSVPMLLVH